ncbi:putative RNA-directed DNA polymerase, eukaryota, reverse transcriptase zinc-binding domain protein [Tanacetum coccineum]
MHEGSWVSKPHQVKEAFLNFFKGKFQENDNMVNFPSITNASGLCSFDRDLLENDISLVEIKTAVWNYGSDKAPGPDGFSFAFVKRFWDILKLDIFEFVNLFFTSCKMPAGSNSSFISLIPKVSNPIHIKDFRPISLIGIHYKIISKILANWLSKVIDKIASHEQFAFIAGCQILDGPLMLSEMIDWYKNRKKKMLIFKVDLEKAFDSVSWRYLDFVLYSHGFGVKWRSWIRECLVSSRTSILVNGSPTSEFSIKHGLRQGDPLSPFLFILVMEDLHVALSNAVQFGLIHGVKFGPSAITLSHLFYADDVVITIEWSSHDMDNIIRVLVSAEEVSLMANNTGCTSGSFPFVYLGLPIGANMNNTSNWKLLLDRFLSRLSSWKANLLFIDRLTLIKVFLESLEIYYLSIFKAPESVLKAMKRIRAMFFLGESQDSKKLAWVKWSNVLSSFDKGGLGIGSLKSFNLSLLQKWRWRFITNPKLLWVKAIKTLHGQEGGFDHQGCKTNGVWGKIVGSSNYLHSNSILSNDSLRFHVGCGTLIRFWKDTWLDRISNGQWCWNWSRSELGVRNEAYLRDLFNEISQVAILYDSDTCVWSIAHDGVFSVGVTRRHIDTHLLPSLEYHMGQVSSSQSEYLHVALIA